MTAGQTIALWTSADVASATAGVARAAWTASGVSIDSRTVKAGDLFVALKGPSFDGHDYVGAALAAGAAAALVHRVPENLSHQLQDKLLTVKDTFTALNDLARAARARGQAKIVAITGSVGKTGTKDALTMALAAQGATHATSGNLNNHWGVPLSLARMPANVAFGIFEIGMNHPGEIAPLARLVRPHAVIVTAVAAVHLEFFDSVAGIADEKASIAAGLVPGGTAILPADSEYFDRLVTAVKGHGCRNVVTFGSMGQADARLVSLAYSAHGMQIAADVLSERITFDMGVSGRHHAINALAVLAAIKAMGADPSRGAATLAKLAPTKGRGNVVTIAVPGGEIAVVDDSYNASPASVKALTETMGRIKADTSARALMALGDMLELGAQGPALHAGLAESIVANGIDLVFTAGPLMEHLHTALPRDKRGGHVRESALLNPLLQGALRPGDIVAVKGSHGSRMNVVVDALCAMSARAGGASPPKTVNGH
ncbi:MAG: UDP-N-acetylmuramoyl-tripeptide--D-alanyl-D-alanine ligase [Rhodospirillaceae bacterium]|nr:UDP-N-acetylmuramoyl-tripeptide--D-alanyl-D-alanine ligase [Rhodospirillaceae bacterium]